RKRIATQDRAYRVAPRIQAGEGVGAIGIRECVMRAIHRNADPCEGLLVSKKDSAANPERAWAANTDDHGISRGAAFHVADRALDVVLACVRKRVCRDWLIVDAKVAVAEIP